MFTDLSHHRTSGSAYGGFLSFTPLLIIIHKARVAHTSQVLIAYGFREYEAICDAPVAFASVCPPPCLTLFYATFNEVLPSRTDVLPTLPYAHT